MAAPSTTTPGPVSDWDIALGADDLVIVAGIPGAGKSTVLHNLDNHASAVILDSEHVAHRLAALLPSWLPYRWYRPLVHLAHRWRIWLVALRACGPVVAHIPATRRRTRVLLLCIGVCARRTRRMLWLDVDPADAWRGQVERGRVSSPRSFARHVRDARTVRCALAAGRGLPGWHSARLLPRPECGTRLVLRPADAPRAQHATSSAGPG